MRWLLTDHQASWVFRWIWNQGEKSDLCVFQEEFLEGSTTWTLMWNQRRLLGPEKKKRKVACIIWPVSHRVDICREKSKIGGGQSRPFRGSVILIEFMRSAGTPSNYGWLTPSLSSENELCGSSQTVGSMIRGRRDSSTFRGGGDKKIWDPQSKHFLPLSKSYLGCWDFIMASATLREMHDKKQPSVDNLEDFHTTILDRQIMRHMRHASSVSFIGLQW